MHPHTITIYTYPYHQHTTKTEEAAIPPLPAHLLPPPECKGKGGVKGGDDKKKKQKKKKKTKREADEGKEERELQEVQEGEKEERRREGLERTVEELLRDYVPASVEGKRPFYCRVCRFQGNRWEIWVGFGVWVGGMGWWVLRGERTHPTLHQHNQFTQSFYVSTQHTNTKRQHPSQRGGPGSAQDDGAAPTGGGQGAAPELLPPLPQAVHQPGAAQGPLEGMGGCLGVLGMLWDLHDRVGFGWVCHVMSCVCVRAMCGDPRAS